MNPTDRQNLASAALVGDIRTFRQVGDAQQVIIALLKDDALGLTDFHRHGLLVALEELTGILEQRAIFLEEHHLLGGES